MSGFAAVFHLEGAQVERAWLEAMARSLAPRGPDGTEIWVSGSAGLCHTLFRTSDANDGGTQIASLDGSVRLVSDARIDDRYTLINRLPQGSIDLRTASAAELILHSYAVWGEACVEHLLGDFAFVIWDARRGRIFGARDQMGVKLFFYAHLGPYLIISDALDAIRQIPIVPSQLDDNAIGDFLLVGFNKYPARTYFKEIRRLPAAHCLSAGSDGLRTKRYWTLPVEEPIYYRRADDYPDCFFELLHTAVRDRLPGGPLGILMSGGLDSPALAVASVQLGAMTTAFTSVFDRLLPDEERHYARLVARHLKIPIEYTVEDDQPWGWEPDSPPIHTPEPLDDPLRLAACRKYYRDLSAHARVFFLGDGPDAALSYEWRTHLTWLIRARKWGRLCKDFGLHFAAHRRIPLLATLPRLLKERYFLQRFLPDSSDASFPSSINQEFGRRLGLKERWEEIREEPLMPHPVRPVAYTSFACDFPMGGTEDYDPAFTGTPSVFLHPFWDVRVVRFLLTVPAIPWCRSKFLVRTALRDLIPEAVRMRPKAPLAGFPYLELIRRHANYPELGRAPELTRYLDIEGLPRRPSQDREKVDQELKALSLNYWLLGLNSKAR